jgi:hypothetical protein
MLSANAVIVRALYDYEVCQDGDLAFRKGDRMEIIGEW